MLLPEQVIPILRSDDQLVRVHATRYFLNAHDIGPLTAGQLWQTMNSLGLGNVSMNMVRLVAQLPQDDASTEALLAALSETQGQKLHPWFVECLEEMDFDQLRRHADAILARTDLSPETLAHLRERLALADAPSAAPLWEQVTHYYDGDDLDWDGGDYRLRFRLLEAVARFGQEAADHAMEIVRSTADEWDERRIFAIDLLARLRHRPALDLVLRAFAESDEDNDPLHEAMQDDIPLIGGVDAVAPIEAILPDLPWGSSLYAIETLARIKHPDSEAALLRLIDNPKLAESRDAIAEALTELCTTDGLPRLRQIVLDGDYDSYDYDLQRDVAACSLMAGPDYDFPELAALREELVADDVENTWRLSETLDLDNLKDDLGEDDFRDDDGFDARGPRVVAPIKNTTPKVGRNDPCPCGSGKKYKKCCLNKQP